MPPFVTFQQFLDQTAAARPEDYPVLSGSGPAPVVPGAGAPPSAADPVAEFNSAKQYVLSLYDGVQAVSTFVEPQGQHVDCVPFEQQSALKAAVAAGHTPRTTAPPPAGSAGGPAAGAANPATPPPLRSGLVDVFGQPISCPAGCVPFRRVTLDEIIRAGGLSRFFRKGPGRNLAARPGQPAPPRIAGPDGRVHLHSVCQATAPGPYLGCKTWLNLWDEPVSPGEFNLSQLWLVSMTDSGKPITIESGWQVCPSHWGISSPVLFVYYNPDGYGPRSGYGQNAGHEGFISLPGSPWVVNADASLYHQASQPGGVQYGFLMQWQRDASGNWWLYCGADEPSLVGVGYFPDTAYANTALAASAQNLQFGGEVCTMEGGSQTGPMGSGQAPNGSAGSNYGRVAFQKDLSVQSSLGATMVPAAVQSVDTGDDAYYGKVVGNSTQPDWKNYLFYGGPGMG
jgi:hypothetical protein